MRIRGNVSMKLKHIILSVLTLTLMGCSPQSSTSSKDPTQGTSNSTDGDTLENKPKDPSTTGEEKENPPSTETDLPNSGTENPDTGDKDNKDIDPDANNTSWGDAEWNAMKKYLGGSILPYIYLGKYIETKWENSSAYKKGFLKILGEVTMDSAFLTSFKNAFEGEKWIVTTTSSSSATATLASANLEVKVLSDSADYVELDAYYNEPYDETSITDYPSEVKTSMSEHLHKHESAIPFIYLGTTNMLVNYNNYYSTFTISADNGSWSDSILTNAKAKLEAAKWNPTEGSNTVSGTMTMSDSCVITLTVKSNSASSATYKKGVIEIKIEEGYNSAGYTMPSTWASTYASFFDNHDIPAIYLGTSSPEFSDSTSYSNKVTITGKTWSDQVLTDAKTVMNGNKDWTVEPTKINSKDGLLCYQKFTDNCRIIFTVGTSSSYTSSGNAQMVVYYEPPFTGTSTTNAWDTDTQDKITECFGTDITIPYVYLNTDDTTASWSTYSNKLTITGAARYNSTIAENAETAFKAAGWKTETTMAIEGKSFSATKTGLSGNKYTATIAASQYSSTSASLAIKCEEVFSVPASGTTWPTAVSENMKKYLNGYVLPYVYLGTLNPSSEYSSYSGKLTITGKTWDDQIYTLFEDALTKNETTSTVKWTVTTKDSTSYGSTRVATATNTADYINYTVTLYKTTSGVPTITIESEETFHEPTNGKWPTAVEDNMTTNFNSHSAPYVYLGTLNPTSNYYQSYHEVDITGGAWNDQVLSIAKKNLTAAGYTVEETLDSNKNAAIEAYIVFTDKSSMRVLVKKSTSSYYSSVSKAMMYVYYGPAVATSTSTTWKTETQTLIDTYLGGYKLPYLSTGTTEMSCSKNTSTGGLYFSYYDYTNGASLTFLYNAIDVLKADDSNWEFHMDSSSTYGKLKGTLVRSDGSTIYLCYYLSGASTAYLYVTYAKKYDVNATGAWNTKVTDAMKNMLEGNVIPYIYLGKADSELTAMTASTSSSSATSKYLYINGGVFDDLMFTAMETALAKDTEHTWRIGYDYSSSTYGETLVASCALASGSHLTIKLYGSSSSASSYNCKTTTLYVYCM